MRITFLCPVFPIFEECLAIGFPMLAGHPLECGLENSLLVVSLPSMFALRYWADLLSGWFETKVLCSTNPHWRAWYLCIAFFSDYHDAMHWYLWILGDQFLRILAPSMRLRNSIVHQVWNWWFRTTSFDILAQGMSKDLARISRRFSWF